MTDESCTLQLPAAQKRREPKNHHLRKNGCLVTVSNRVWKYEGQNFNSKDTVKHGGQSILVWCCFAASVNEGSFVFQQDK